MVKVSGFEATELGPPPAAAWVALTEWPALVSGVVGVKFQVLPATVVVPATLPSMETVTMSPLTPDPEMVGSAVVVMMMPLVGAVMIGAVLVGGVMVGGGGGDADGGVGTLMVKVSGFEATELGPPPAAAWVALTEWPALVSGVVGVKFQVLPATVVVPATLPSMETVTMSPLTPDPEMVGSAVVVMMMPLVGAVMIGAVLVGGVMVGGGGGDADGGVGTLMVKVSGFEATELGPPPAAAWVALTEWPALVSGVVGVKFQVLPATVVVPATLPSMETVTMSPLTPDPEMVGSAVVVMMMPLVGAVMIGAVLVGGVMVGGGGGDADGGVGTLMVKVSGFEATELGPPPAAAWVALTEWPALVSGVVGVKFQVLPATVVVPATLPSMETVTMSPLTPDPEMVGSAVVVMMMPLVGAVMVGAAGGTLMVKVSGLDAAELGPPPAVAWVAVTEWPALVSGVVGVKFQVLPATVVVPATLPSMETVTMSPLTPDPEMVGSAVVVMMMPLVGAVMVGAAGGGD